MLIEAGAVMIAQYAFPKALDSLLDFAGRRLSEDDSKRLSRAWRNALIISMPRGSGLKDQEKDRVAEDLTLRIAGRLLNLSESLSVENPTRKLALVEVTSEVKQLPALSYEPLVDWRTGLRDSLEATACENFRYGGRSLSSQEIHDAVGEGRTRVWADKVVWNLEHEMRRDERLRTLIESLQERDQALLQMQSLGVARDISVSLRHMSWKVVAVATSLATIAAALQLALD